MGDAPGTAVLDYTIPAMEVSVLAGSGVVGPSATVRATSTFVHILDDGFVLPVQELFIYEMILLTDGFTTFSPDLLQHIGHPAFFTDGDLIQYKTLERSLSLDVARLFPRETLVIGYSVKVSTDTGGASEVGMQALFGDPLNLSLPAGGGFSLSLASPPPVPEPATSALLASGLAVVGLLRRRWVHGRSSN